MTGAPPRGLEERLRDTRAKLESDYPEHSEARDPLNLNA